MPASLAKFGVLLFKVLYCQIIIERRAVEEDFQFLKSSVISRITPDFSGYDTRRTRETGQSVKSKSRLYDRPMINKTPTDLSTMLTAMCDLENISKDVGQSFSMLTCDQQLYRVMLDVIWANPPRWVGFIPRIGGMHWLMFFAGSVD